MLKIVLDEKFIKERSKLIEIMNKWQVFDNNKHFSVYYPIHHRISGKGRSSCTGSISGRHQL